MPVELSDPASGTTLTLFGSNSLSDSQNAGMDVSPPPGFDSEEAFLVSMEQDGQVTLQGAATAKRLSRAAAFSSDPITALAEFCATLEAFVNGGQGKGYDLTKNYRDGTTYTGYVQSMEWSVRGGEDWEAGYALEFVRGEGFGVQNDVSVGPVNPGGPDFDGDGEPDWEIRVDGQTIPTFTEFQMAKEQEVSAARRLYADSPDENDLTSDGGAVRTITVTGEVEGDGAERRQFDADLTDTLGQDTLIDLEEPFTGRTFTGMVEDFEGTDEAGLLRIGEYGFSLVEGEN